MAGEGLKCGLGEGENEPDANPDEKQAGQDPEEERGLADRQPRNLRAIEEETRAAERAAVIVVFGDLAAHRLRRVLGHSSCRVEVSDPLAASAISLRAGHHILSLAPAHAVELCAIQRRGGRERGG
jgi:hypothetical protein